jgi:serine protease AprX
MRDPARGGFALWTTSGRGPTADRRMKPDLVAAGYQITAARAGSATGSMELTGSSMATPFVAGVCALMLAADPGLTPTQVKRLLKQTAVDFGPEGDDVDYGAGRLDAFAAIRACEPPGEHEESEGPRVPAHRFFSGLLEDGGSEEWTIEVTDRKDPIAAVLVAPEWTADAPSRFQIELRDPKGAVLTYGGQERRAQIISFQPLVTGAYTLRVEALSGRGPYFLDVSCNAAEP